MKWRNYALLWLWLQDGARALHHVLSRAVTILWLLNEFPQHYCQVADRNDLEIHLIIQQNKRMCLLQQSSAQVEQEMVKKMKNENEKNKKKLLKLLFELLIDYTWNLDVPDQY